MTKTERESISFSREYDEEYKFFMKECRGNKSWYICELLRKERLRKRVSQKKIINKILNK